jgi:hypothetical protein
MEQSGKKKQNTVECPLEIVGIPPTAEVKMNTAKP